MVPFGLLHIFQAEFLDARLIRRNGGALHRDPILPRRVGRIDRDLIVRFVGASELKGRNTSGQFRDNGRMRECSRIHCQINRVISSPSNSPRVSTLILVI